MHEAPRTREKSKKKSRFRSSIFTRLVSIFKDVSLGLRGEVSTFHRIFYLSPRFCERSENDRDFSVLPAAVTQFPRAEKLRQIIHSNFMDRGEIKTDTLTYIAAWETSSRTGGRLASLLLEIRCRRIQSISRCHDKSKRSFAGKNTIPFATRSVLQFLFFFSFFYRKYKVGQKFLLTYH